MYKINLFKLSHSVKRHFNRKAKEKNCPDRWQFGNDCCGDGAACCGDDVNMLDVEIAGIVLARELQYLSVPDTNILSDAIAELRNTLFHYVYVTSE